MTVELSSWTIFFIHILVATAIVVGIGWGLFAEPIIRTLVIGLAVGLGYATAYSVWIRLS